MKPVWDEVKRAQEIAQNAVDLATSYKEIAYARSAEVEVLRAFARRVLRAWPDGDLDGGELQDAAIEAGLLRKVDPPPREPCGEECRCADYCDREEFERGAVVCYRLSPEVRDDH